MPSSHADADVESQPESDLQTTRHGDINTATRLCELTIEYARHSSEEPANSDNTSRWPDRRAGVAFTWESGRSAPGGDEGRRGRGGGGGEELEVRIAAPVGVAGGRADTRSGRRARKMECRLVFRVWQGFRGRRSSASKIGGEKMVQRVVLLGHSLVAVVSLLFLCSCWAPPQDRGKRWQYLGGPKGEQRSHLPRNSG